MELAIEGHTYEQIAREVGYSNRGSAYRAVSKALASHEVEAVEEYRRVECERLDTLQAALWPAAVGGDIQAARAVADIIVTRSKLLGLFPNGKPAPKLEPVTVVIPDGWTYNERRQAWDVTPTALARHKHALRCAP